MVFTKTIELNKKDLKFKEDLKEIASALEEKGYNASKQITEYLISGEIGYISSYKDSRNKISLYDRRDLIEEMLKEYIK